MAVYGLTDPVKAVAQYLKDAAAYHDRLSQFTGLDFKAYVTGKAALKAKSYNPPIPAWRPGGGCGWKRRLRMRRRPTVRRAMGADGFITLDLKEAAAFLHMSPAVLRQKARAGIIKGAKPGKCWVFLVVDLTEYLRSLYRVPGQAPQSGWKEVSQCHSTNAANSGGSDSPPPMASLYAARLGLETGSKPRSTTTD
jgi:hypothetical protein